MYDLNFGFSRWTAHCSAWARGIVNLALVAAVVSGGATPASAVALSPVNHATDDIVSGTRTIYFPVRAATTNAQCAAAKLFPTSLTPISFDSAPVNGTFTGVMVFSIASTKALDEINGNVGGAVAVDDIVIRAENTVGNTQIELFGIDSIAASVDNLQIRYGTTAGAIVRFGMRLNGASGFCNTFNTGAGNCAIGLAGQPSPALIKFGLVKKGQLLSDANADTLNVNVTAVDCPAHDGTALVLPSSWNFALVPGDQRIKLDNRTTAPSPTVGLKSVVVFATKQGNPTFGNTEDPDGKKVEFQGQINGGIYTIDGLQNDTQYCMGLGYVNKGGFVTTNATPAASDAIDISGIPSNTNCATPSQIDGFLDRSTCFIASAAYGDEWDPRLEVLRQFRDQVLLGVSVGRAFVEWYYDWSPSAAHWLLSNPGYKSLVRVALIPLVEGARVSLWIRANMWVFSVLFFLGTAMMVTVTMRRRSSA